MCVCVCACVCVCVCVCVRWVGEYKNDYVKYKPFLDIESINLSIEQWLLVKALESQSRSVENHWVAPRPTQIFLRLIK